MIPSSMKTGVVADGSSLCEMGGDETNEMEVVEARLALWRWWVVLMHSVRMSEMFFKAKGVVVGFDGSGGDRGSVVISSDDE